jgi:RNA polymerase sigma factor (TIGR02999 family)
MAAPPPSHEITSLLREWSEGDEAALDRLFPLVYDGLRRLASRSLLRERAGHTLQATALVNEAYLKLVDQHAVRWQERAHFFAVAARIMRRILVDHARRHNAGKRGGGAARLTIQDSWLAATGPADVDLLALEEALERLEAIDPRQSRIVELRFFAGLTVEEAADVLDVSPATVKNDWRVARAWLFAELSGTPT